MTSKLKGETRSTGGGIINSFRNFFNMSSIESVNLLGVLEVESEVKRIANAQRLYDYYRGDATQIETYLEEALSRTFTQDDIKQFQLLYFPLLKRIIDKISLVYKGNVIRELEGEKDNLVLNELLENSDIEIKSRH